MLLHHSDVESFATEQTMDDINEQIENARMAEEDDNKLDRKYTPKYEVCDAATCAAVDTKRSLF